MIDKILLLLLLLFVYVYAKPKRPHVVVFVIDDLGWSDVSYRKNDQGASMYTPYIDSLAKSGVLLDNYYTQPVCSPSRTAFMQGRFPFRQGMRLQNYCTLSPAATGHMNLTQPTIAEALRDVGYRTAAVGKWHCGYQKFDYTPTGRGFESHVGYFQGEINYYNHTFQVPHNFIPFIDVIGVDWWHNRTVAKNENGIYSKQILDRESQRVLNNYNPSSKNPLFLYFAHQIAHLPLDAPPQRWFQHCSHVKNAKRKIYCAMMAACDDSLRQLVEQLRAKQMWNDTILIVTTDNGGSPPVPGFLDSIGSNYPLRAGKGQLFQGGVRGIGFVNGGVVPDHVRGSVVEKPLMHIVDWWPTIAHLAGAAVPSNLDGRDLWHTLVNDQSFAVRDTLPLNINHAIEYPNSGHQVGILDADGYKLIKQRVEGPVLNYDGWFPFNAASIPPPHNPTPGKFLFNVFADPNEHNNLYSSNHSRVLKLEQALAEFERDYGHPQSNFFYPGALPWFHDGVWAPFDPVLSHSI